VRKLFWLGLLGLLLFELLRVWLIMPMPGSQRMDSLGLAYALHAWRLPLRLLFGAMIGAGLGAAFRARRRWLSALAMVVVAGAVGFINGQLVAEKMFRQPAQLAFVPRAQSALGDDALVLGLEHGGEAHAWPIRYLVYHHQVQDTVGGQPVLATYCSVCRTGRVFEPLVQGRPETFRLVGMDHFNAMLEDTGTRSWWRQATGEAVAGPLRGARLPELDGAQMTLGTWTALHPGTLVMQPDPAAADQYDPEARFERGASRSELTGTDPESWHDKSWVVGVELGGASKAWDWNALKQARVLNDVVGGRPLVLALAPDGQSFAAFERPSAAEEFTLQGDGLAGAGRTWDFTGRDRADPAHRLPIVAAHQEFWHSWRTFHPDTLR
jgi:hypothetical protein